MNTMRLVSLSAFCSLLFFNSSPALGQSWDFFEGHAVKGNNTGAEVLKYKNTDAENEREFVGICQDMCASGEGDGENGSCGGFVLNYANKKKNKPKFCVFKKTGTRPYERESKDTYLMARDDRGDDRGDRGDDRVDDRDRDDRDR